MFFGGAAVGSVDSDDAAGNFLAVKKVGKRAAMLVDRGEIDIEAGDMFDVSLFQLI